jgi:putative transposase
MDRLLAEIRAGPFYLRMPAIAQMVIDTIRRGEREFNQYALHAFVIMPNHVHVLLTPAIPLPKITGSIKSVTGRNANEMLDRKGPFWQNESYDHLVRSAEEYERVRRYIEYNPVAAGLAKHPSDFRWSSAYNPEIP